jgi:hypothetical protein
MVRDLDRDEIDSLLASRANREGGTEWVTAVDAGLR